MKRILPLFLAIFLSLVSTAISGQKPEFHYYEFGFARQTFSYVDENFGSGEIVITPIGIMGVSAHFNDEKHNLMTLNIEDLKKMRMHLKKAIKWSKIAIEKNVDHEKDLGKIDSYKAEWSSQYDEYGKERYVILCYSGKDYLYDFKWELTFSGVDTMEEALKTINKLIEHYNYYIAYEKERKKKLPPEMSQAEKDKLFQ